MHERLKVIRRLSDSVAEDAKERVLQEYIFEHLWLLDPAWERATEYADMERRIQATLPDEPDMPSSLRTDIRYRRVAGGHVIVELKRGSRRLAKTAIEEQLRRYMNAARTELRKSPKQAPLPIDGICILGELPRGWDDPEDRRRDEASLQLVGIRVLTYAELIENAESAYRKFVAATGATGRLTELIEQIRKYESDA